jgi:hypothetical protein
MKKKYHYIYITFCLVNDKIYVGRRSCDCLPEEDTGYLGSGVIFRNALRKYGKENFEKEIVEVCNYSELKEKEIFYIAYFEANNRKIGYNLTKGGEDGDWWEYITDEQKAYYTEQSRIRAVERFNNNPELRDKFFKAAKEHTQSEEFKIKNSERFKQLWQSPEYREKLMKNLLKATQSPEFRLLKSKKSKEYFSKEDNLIKHSNAVKLAFQREDVKENHKNAINKLWENPEYAKKVRDGLKLTASKPEWKEHQSRISKKRWEKEGEKEKHAIWIKDKWQNDEEFKNKMKHRYDEGHPNALFIVSVNINTKEWDVYMSTNEAGKKLGLFRKSISKCCKNQYGVYEGYVFAFVEDFDENNIDGIIEEKKKLPELLRIEKKPNKSIVIIKDMAIQEFTSVKSACKVLSLDHTTVFRILKGERKNCYKGYSFYEV